jgi:hypothetical protein
MASKLRAEFTYTTSSRLAEKNMEEQQVEERKEQHLLHNPAHFSMAL